MHSFVSSLPAPPPPLTPPLLSIQFFLLAFYLKRTRFPFDAPYCTRGVEYDKDFRFLGTAEGDGSSPLALFSAPPLKHSVPLLPPVGCFFLRVLYKGSVPVGRTRTRMTLGLPGLAYVDLPRIPRSPTLWPVFLNGRLAGSTATALRKWPGASLPSGLWWTPPPYDLLSIFREFLPPPLGEEHFVTAATSGGRTPSFRGLS